jgi:diguanylate cyclase (GGDEF)-like protein
MTPFPRSLLLAGALLALATPLAGTALRESIHPAIAVLMGLIGAGFVIAGLALGSSRGSERRETLQNPSPPAPREPAPRAMSAPTGRAAALREDDSTAEEEAVVAFAHRLVIGTTSEHVHLILARHLPPFVGTRRIFLATHLAGRRQVIVPEAAEGERTKPLLIDHAQEWTTFPLRTDDGVVGVIGVEGRRLGQAMRRRIHLVSPVVAQVLVNAQTVDRLRETSLVDLLTGAATRREGLARLGSELKRAQRTGSAMAVLMLDLDQFKVLNDRFGHATGDAVLTAVGRTLMRTLRASDIRCRWGGEEFLVVLPETDVLRAEVVAGGLLRNIAATTVPTPSGPVGSTVSIGVTTTAPGETDVEAILQRADVALYRAKDAGRSCVRVVLSDHGGYPAGDPPPPPHPSTLAFPDRRNPNRPDRRGVPGPGRRHTDPQPEPTLPHEDQSTPGRHQVPTTLP